MNTTHDDHPDPTVNPLVSEMLAAGKDQTTSIEGFVGKVEAGMVRIYANLGLNHYIEVPEAGVVMPRSVPSKRPSLSESGSSALMSPSPSESRE